MKSARLAVLAALAVVAVAAATWVAGPVDVGDPRFSLELGFDPPDLEDPEEPEEPDCEENGLGCEQASGAASDAVTIGALMLTIALAALLAWLAAKVIRKLAGWVRETRLPIPRDETIDAHIREALRGASQRAAREIETVPSGEATDAVVACWVLLEHSAERVGTPRAASATPTEFTVELLREHDADPRAVATLLDLYHAARFGTSPLPESASGTAADALWRIADSLAGAEVSSSAEEAS